MVKLNIEKLLYLAPMIRKWCSYLTFAALLGVAMPAYSQSRPVIVKLPKLQSLVTSRTDSVQVINFWATWCGPCVKELPIFEALHAKGGTTKVTLVSMDLELDPNPDKVYKFATRKNLQSRVWILDERDPNVYIDQIDPSWSGALPATLVVNQKTGKRVFHEGELNQEKLNELISKTN